MLTGGCHCGAIRYEVRAQPVHRTICHCEMCRGTTGAPCVAWFTVPVDAFHLSGSPTLYRSSAHGTRAFCPACGTQITFADDALPDEIDVSTCSLAQPAAAAPTSHIFTASQVPWMQLADGLPRFPRSRSEAEK
ncbi:GFA family protein [Massilia sp. PAMC28688]|uniref:GFA family protein n=1 Tax=Massilia sp. PAMC28688 TaxID=2861283 RepID=UPI001E2D58E8|nr:GFA family protein [Massilia sp. PAMC28688]